MPTVRKPARSIARRTFAKAARRQRAASSARRAKWNEQFRASLAKKIKKNVDRRERLEMLSKMQLPERTGRIMLRPESRHELQEIMEALEQRQIPEKFHNLSGIKSLSAAEQNELIRLLHKYYQYYITGEIIGRTEWKMLERLMERIRIRGAKKDEKTQIISSDRERRRQYLKRRAESAKKFEESMRKAA